MSKIDALIKHYCPDGVAFKELGEVANFKRGKSLAKADKGNGEVPIILYGELYTEYGDAITEVVSSSSPERAQRGTPVHSGDILLPITSTTKEAQIGKASMLKVGNTTVYLGGDAIALEHNQCAEYLVQVLNSSWFETFKMRERTGTTVSHLSPTGLRKIKVPIPPIEVQQEIASILDKFTSLEAELEAELEARRKQHTHYWNYLLTPRETWKSTTLGSIADIYDGPHATPKKTLAGPWYLSISSLKNGRIDLTESAHLDEDQYPIWTRRVAPRIGDTLFSYETRIGQAAFWDTDEPAALGRRMGLLRPHIHTVHPRFLTLLYLGPQFQKIIKAKTVSGSTVDRIPIANMASWEVIIPPLDEQAEIIQQVDAFDALVNDLNVGLPAELTARRKQYEYYRDTLLTFQELPA